MPAGDSVPLLCWFLCWGSRRATSAFREAVQGFPAGLELLSISAPLFLQGFVCSQSALSELGSLICAHPKPQLSQSPSEQLNCRISALAGLQGCHRGIWGCWSSALSAPWEGLWGQSGIHHAFAALPWLFSFGDRTGSLQPLREEPKLRSVH